MALWSTVNSFDTAWAGGVEILYKVTLRHAKLWITRFDRFNERWGGGGGAVRLRPNQRAGGLSAFGRFDERGGGCPPSADSTSGGGAVRLRPIRRAGGGVRPPSADSTSGGGGGWGVRPPLADSTSGGAVR